MQRMDFQAAAPSGVGQTRTERVYGRPTKKRRERYIPALPVFHYPRVKAIVAERLRVFVVEDSSHVFEALRSLILDVENAELAGHASEAVTAISAIRDSQPDVVILDFQLTTGNGIDVLRSLGSLPKKPLTIVFSNHVEDRMRTLCRSLGADHTLTKRDGADQLIEILRSAASSRDAD